MPQEFYLSIVIPAYREETRIHKILEAIVEYQKGKDFLIETLVVIDGSPDNTVDSVKKFSDKIPNLRVINRLKNKGKGYTVKEGVLHSSGKFILFADADNSTPVKQADKLLKYVDKYQVVIGSRYCRGGKLAHPQPFYRVLGGRGMNLIIQLLAARGIKDTQCGFKLFEREAALKIFKLQTFDRFSFDIELLAIARKLGYKTKEVGITWYDDPHSTVNPIKDGLQMVRDSWIIRKNITKGLYR